MTHHTRPTPIWHSLWLTAALLAPCAWAQGHDMAQHTLSNGATTAPSDSAPQALPWINAQVQRIDRSAGKVTLKHAEITNLEMPGMTMVFVAQDPSQLAHIQPGDAVQFTASKVNGQYVAVSVRPTAGDNAHR